MGNENCPSSKHCKLLTYSKSQNVKDIIHYVNGVYSAFSYCCCTDNKYVNISFILLLFIYNSYHFEVHHIFLDGSNQEKVSYTHMLSKGKTAEKHYGINICFMTYSHYPCCIISHWLPLMCCYYWIGLQLAEISTLPRCIIENAKQFVERITAQMKVLHNL